MKNNKALLFSKSILICTDGSTLNIPFIYPREDIGLNPDIKSSMIWLPESTNLDLDELADRSTKFKKYKFNFESLVEL